MISKTRNALNCASRHSGAEWVKSAGDIRIGYDETADEYMSAYCSFALGAEEEIQTADLMIYREDEGDAFMISVSALPANQHTAETTQGENITGYTLGGQIGWHAISLTGDLMDAIRGYDGKFNIYINRRASGSITIGGGTNSNKSPRLRTQVRTNEKSRVQTYDIAYELGETVTLLINKARAANRSKITWSIGEYAQELPETLDTSASFYLPMGLEAEFEDGSTLPLDVSLDTYDEAGEHIGVDSITVPVSLPNEFKPGIENMTVTEANAAVAALGEGYIEGFSKLRIAGTAVGTEGFTELTGSYDGCGVHGTFPITNGAFSFETDYIHSGELFVTVRDARHMYETVETEITAKPYYNPELAFLRVERCDAQGATDPDGSYARVSGRVFSDVSDDLEVGIVIEYEKNSEWHTAFGGLLGIGDQEFSQIVNGGFAGNASYNFRVSTYDTLTGLQRAKLNDWDTLPKSNTAANYKPDGNGVAFGKMATEDGFHVYWDAVFHGNVSQSDVPPEDTLTVTVNSETWTVGASITVTRPGKYLVMFGAEFDIEAIGCRFAELEINDYLGKRVGLHAVDEFETIAEGCMVVDVTETTTMTVNAYQDSGVSLEAETQISCFRML